MHQPHGRPVGIVKDCKQPVGLGTCGPDDGSFFSQEGAYLLGDTECSVPVPTIKSIGWPPTLILIMGSLGAQLKRAQSPVLGFCSS